MKKLNQKTNSAKSRAVSHTNRHYLIAGGTFIVLALLLTWPLIRQLNDSIAGETDAFQLIGSIYNLDRVWTFTSLFSISGLLSIFSVQFPLLLLHKLFGDPAGYNMYWLLSFVLTGFSGYCLAFYLSKRQLTSLIAGGIFTFAPIHFAFAAGFHGIGHLEWYPLAILFLMKLVRRPTVKYSLMFLLFSLLIVSYDIHGAVFLGLFSVIYIIYEMIRRPAILHDRRYRVYGVAVILLIGLLFGVKTRGLIAIATSGSSYMKPSMDEIINYSNDVTGLITPYAYHPIWGNEVWLNFSSRYIKSIGENTNYIGGIVLLLALVGMIAGRSKSWLKYWLGITVVFTVLSFGPFLKWGGVIEPKIPLPYLLLYKYIPFIDNLRGVGRFFLPAMLGLALMGGYGFSVVYDWLKHRRLGFLAFGIAALLILDYLAVPRLSSSSVPKFYTQLQQESGDYSILQIPSVTSYNPSSYLAYYNSQHNKKPLAKKGYFSRDQYDNERLDWLRKTPVLGNLLYSLPQGQSAEQDVIAQDYAALAQSIFQDNSLKYIILHKNFITDNPYIGYGILPENFELTKRFIEDTLKLPRYFEDGDTLVYLTTVAATTKPKAALYTRLGNNWQMDKDPVTWKSFALGGQDSSLVVHNISNDNKLVGITFQAQSVGGNYRASLTYQDKTIDVIDIGPDPINYTVYLPNTPAGDSSLSFSLLSTDNDATQNLNQVIKLQSVKYVRLSDVSAPPAYDKLLQKTDNLSVLQVGYRNLYTVAPQTGGQARFGNHKVVQTSDIDFSNGVLTNNGTGSPIRNHPIIRYMQNGTYHWGWLYNNEIGTYSDLYWYYLATNNLLDQNIGYVVLDKKLYTAEQLAYSKIYFQNAISTTKLFEDNASVLYQITSPQQPIETRELRLNGTICDVYNTKIKDGDEISWIESRPDTLVRFTGQLHNPTPENRIVYFKRGDEFVGRYVLYPGDNTIVLTIGRLSKGLNALAFFVEFGQPGEIFGLSKWAVFPTDYSSFVEYAKSQDPDMASLFVDSFENQPVNYDESIGEVTTLDSLSGLQSYVLKPVCIASKEPQICSSALSLYFNGYTTSAEASAWVKMDAWPENTVLSMKLINNDGVLLKLKTPALGLGWSPTASGEFEHNFKLGEWNNLRVDNSDTGELTLYENDTPIFWCEHCAQSRLLGFTLQLETTTPLTKAMIDDFKYNRTFLK